MATQPDPTDPDPATPTVPIDDPVPEPIDPPVVTPGDPTAVAGTRGEPPEPDTDPWNEGP